MIHLCHLPLLCHISCKTFVQYHNHILILLLSRYTVSPPAQGPLLWSCYSHTSHPPFCPSLLISNPWQPLLCLHFYSFVTSRMLHKEKDTIFNLWNWLFFPVSIITLRFIQIVWHINSCSSVFLSSIPWHGSTTVA